MSSSLWKCGDILVTIQTSGKMSVKGREFRVEHIRTSEGRFLDYIIRPLGYRFNQDLKTARKGDVLRFADGSSAWIYRVAVLNIGSAMADCLCRALYGFGAFEILGIWQENLRAAKKDVRLISESECLIVFYENREDEERYENQHKIYRGRFAT